MRVLLPTMTLAFALAACGGTPTDPASSDEQYLRTLAAETWSYLDSHLSPVTGFPTDSQKPGGTTNTTNIGLYLAALGPAERMGLISHDSAVARARRIIESIGRLESRHGFLPNWVSVDGDTRLPDGVFAVSDFNKIVCGLILVRQFYPELAQEASAITDRVEWSWLYDAAAKRGHWGFDLRNDKPVGRADFWLASDCRLAVFSMIASGAATPELWDVMGRRRINADGLAFLEPGYEFGGLFMHAMDAIFLDERGTEMGRSIADLAWHQIREARRRDLPAWGWSNCNIPGSGYTEGGFLPWWVVTPHASALVIEYYPRHAMNNLRELERRGTREPLAGGVAYGFRDALDLKTGRVDERYLALDQAMLFLALANYLDDGIVRRTFSSDPFVQKGLGLLGERLKSDPALIAEWARRDASEPDPVVFSTSPPDSMVLDFRRSAIAVTVTGGAIAAVTGKGLVIDYDFAQGGEMDVNIPLQLDARGLGDIVVRARWEGATGSPGGVRLYLRDENSQSQYSFLPLAGAATRDYRIRDEQRFGLFSRPQAIRALTVKFWEHPWYYGNQRTVAGKGRLVIESIGFYSEAASLKDPAAETETNSLVCDFESAERTNSRGGDFGTWASSSPAGRCTEKVVSGGYGGGNAWRIDYDISESGSFSGTWMKLGGLSASPGATLSFRVRVPAGTPAFFVELKRNGAVARKAVENLGRGWTPVRLALSEFGSLGSFDGLTELVFVFDQNICPSRKGTVLIDEVRIE